MLLAYKKTDGSEAKVRLKTLTHSAPVTMGRDKHAGIVLDDPQASRIHAAIRYWDDIFIIRDMGSINGTLLNGEKIDVAKLSPGDIIVIGNTEITVTSESSRSDVTAVIKQHDD